MARPCFKLEKVHPDPVAGVDEAGCAPLAGPVVAAAVVLDRERFPRGIDDSKVVPVKDREAICAKLYKVASIVAKVTRDRIMADHALDHPGYGWERNKGYPTPEHQEALKRLGPTPLHRRSFAPVRQYIMDL